MKKTVLIFPTINSLADFVVSYEIPNAIVNSHAQSVTAFLTDEWMGIARAEFGAATAEEVMQMHWDE